jgi:hypothetical protein
MGSMLSWFLRLSPGWGSRVHMHICTGRCNYVSVDSQPSVDSFQLAVLNYCSIRTSFPGPLSLGPPWCMLLCCRLELTHSLRQHRHVLPLCHSFCIGAALIILLVGGSLQHSGGIVKKGTCWAKLSMLCCPYFAKTIHVYSPALHCKKKKIVCCAHNFVFCAHNSVFCAHNFVLQTCTTHPFLCVWDTHLCARHTKRGVV